MLHTRGKRVVAEATIPDALLRTESCARRSELMFRARQVANLGGFMSGVNNNGAHSANGITAMFIATGQDVANVAESSAAFVYAELPANGDYYYSVTIPSLIVATYGGGTGLATQRECLEMLGCYGSGQGAQARRDRRGHRPVRRALARLGDRRRGVGRRPRPARPQPSGERRPLFGAEDAVAGVAEAGADVAALVELAVDRGGHRSARRGARRAPPRGPRARRRGRRSAAAWRRARLQRAAARCDRAAAGGEHRVDARYTSASGEPRRAVARSSRPARAPPRRGTCRGGRRAPRAAGRRKPSTIPSPARRIATTMISSARRWPRVRLERRLDLDLARPAGRAAPRRRGSPTPRPAPGGTRRASVSRSRSTREAVGEHGVVDDGEPSGSSRGARYSLGPMT